METSIEPGVNRILTLGNELSALAGLRQIICLIENAAGRIQIIAAGGNTVANLAQV